jgi:hypothetical protein
MVPWRDAIIFMDPAVIAEQCEQVKVNKVRQRHEFLDRELSSLEDKPEVSAARPVIEAHPQVTEMEALVALARCKNDQHKTIECFRDYRFLVRIRREICETLSPHASAGAEGTAADTTGDPASRGEPVNVVDASTADEVWIPARCC